MPRRSASPSAGPIPSGCVSAHTSTPVYFLDETGTIASDRFFAIGVLKLDNPSNALWELERLRNRNNFHASHGREFKFSWLKKSTLPLYKEAVDIVMAHGASLGCFIVDRTVADPIARYGTKHMAYAKVASQLLHATIKRREIATVIADAYSTPNAFPLEKTITDDVNRRLRRLAVTNVVPTNSRASDGLQLADVLLGAIVHEFRHAAMIPGYATGPWKTELAAHVRSGFGVTTCLPELEHGHPKLRVRIHLPPGTDSVV